MKSLLFLVPLLLVVALVVACLLSPAARRVAADIGYGISQMLFGHMARNGLVLGVYNVPEGSKFYFSTTFAAAKTVTALTNANPAVATATAHGYSDNDEILLASGWEDATDSVWRVDQQDSNSFTVLGLNATDTDWYAAGTGTGSAQKISDWVEIPQVLQIATSGGDPRYTQITPLAKRNAINRAVGFNAANITLTLGHDAGNANYQEMLDISRRLAHVALKMVIPGSVIYAYGTLACSEVPSLNSGQVNSVQAALSVDGRMISYAT